MQDFSILKYFEYDHLPTHLQEISKPFCELAVSLVEKFPASNEAHMCIRKLLEAKDCAVRAAL